jgi:hypothetical protein
VAVCPSVPTYTADFRARLVAEVSALPATSTINIVLADYTKLADAARACAAARP